MKKFAFLVALFTIIYCLPCLASSSYYAQKGLLPDEDMKMYTGNSVDNMDEIRNNVENKVFSALKSDYADLTFEQLKKYTVYKSNKTKKFKTTPAGQYWQKNISNLEKDNITKILLNQKIESLTHKYGNRYRLVTTEVYEITYPYGKQIQKTYRGTYELVVCQEIPYLNTVSYEEIKNEVIYDNKIIKTDEE